MWDLCCVRCVLCATCTVCTCAVCDCAVWTYCVLRYVRELCVTTDDILPQEGCVESWLTDRMNYPVWMSEVGVSHIRNNSI